MRLLPRFLPALFLLVLALLPTRSLAQRVEVGPFVGLRFGGGFEDAATGIDYDLAEGLAYGLTLNLQLNGLGEDTRLELLWSHQDSQIRSEDPTWQDLDAMVDVFQIGLTRDFGSGKLVPFLVGTVGANYLHTEEDSDLRFTFGLGGGARYTLTRNLVARVDLRGFGTVVESSGTVISSGGVYINYSGTMFWQGEVAASLSLRF